MDNCSTSHIVNNLNSFDQYEEFQEKQNMVSINGGQAIGSGIVKVKSRVYNKYIQYELHNVLYIPTAPCNIVSMLKLEDGGVVFKQFKKQQFNYIEGYYESKQMLVARRMANSNDLYRSTIMVHRDEVSMMTMLDWHKRLGHQADDRLRNTEKIVEGMKIEQDQLNNKISSNCEICVKSKHKRRTFNHKLLKESRPGYAMHSDLCYMTTRSIGGKAYYVLFIDEATRFKYICFLSDLTSNSMLKAIKYVYAQQNAKLGFTPKRLHADNGTNYKNKEVEDYLLGVGSSYTFCTPNNHEQNGLAEKSIQDISAIVRSLLMQAKIPQKVWAEAANHAVFLDNVTYKNSIKSSPYNLYYGTKPNLSELKVFGSEAMVYIEKNKRNKLSPRSNKMKFVGYDGSMVNYRIINSNHNKVDTFTNVYFIKDQIHHSKTSTQNSTQNSTRNQDNNCSSTSSSDSDRSSDDDLDESNDMNVSNNLNESNLGDESGDLDDTLQNEQSQTQIELNDQRKSELNTLIDQLIPSTNAEQQTTIKDQPNDTIEQNEMIYDESYLNQNDKAILFDISDKLSESLFSNIKLLDVKIPKSTYDIFINKYADYWLDAADQEFLSLLGHNTWNLVSPPNDINQILNGNLIGDLKSEDGIHVSRFRMRFVVDGRPLQNTAKYSPVVNMDSMRSLLAYAVKNKMIIHTIDIKNAYLNSEIQQEVYIRQHPLYIDPNRPTHVYLLNKSQYGLPNSSYEWYSTFVSFLLNNGFTQSKIDQCIFYTNDYQVFLVLYVDDILLLSLMLEFINKIKNLIRTKFQFRDKASIKSFLGIEFKYDQQRLMMSNKSKIMNLCEQYKDMLPRATKVPIVSTELIMKPSPTSKHVHTYQSIIGSLNFIACRTRPDLTIYIHKLSKFMRSPTEHQFQLLLNLLAYTINTANYELIYETRSNFIDELEFYSDSGFIDKENFTGRSVSGVVVFYFGMVVLWSANSSQS